MLTYILLMKMTENTKPELREKWLFVSNIPLLFNKENVVKQMEMEVIFMDKEKPMVVKDVETVETLMKAMKELKIEQLPIMTPEKVKHDREAVRGYLV